jgi:hypothetical protein
MGSGLVSNIKMVYFWKAHGGRRVLPCAGHSGA